MKPPARATSASSTTSSASRSQASSQASPIDLNIRGSSLHRRRIQPAPANLRPDNMTLQQDHGHHEDRDQDKHEQEPNQQELNNELPHKGHIAQVKTKKLFPQKLWDLINDQRYSLCLRWSDDGQLVYLNRDEFEECYLKTNDNQFQTQKAISFVRQMNMYGFRKVDENYYENDNFKRGCEHLLKNMIRKNPNKSAATAGSDLTQFLFSQPSHSPRAGPIGLLQNTPPLSSSSASVSPIQFQQQQQQQQQQQKHASQQPNNSNHLQRRAPNEFDYNNDDNYHKLIQYMFGRQERQAAATNGLEQQLNPFVPFIDSPQQQQHLNLNQNHFQPHRQAQPLQRPPSGDHSSDSQSPMHSPFVSLSNSVNSTASAARDYSMQRLESLQSSGPKKVQHSATRSAQRRFKQTQPLQRRQPQQQPQPLLQASSAMPDGGPLMAILTIALNNAAAAAAAAAAAQQQPQAPQVQAQQQQQQQLFESSNLEVLMNLQQLIDQHRSAP